MKKRLRFSMPHVPLKQHKHIRSTEDRKTKNYGTNVATMAKLITSGERQRRRNNAQVSCEVDIETSDEDENEHTLLLQSTV